MKTDFSILSDQKCIHCGTRLKQNSVKKGHIMCFDCYSVIKAMSKENPANTTLKIALEHTSKKPWILKEIFNFK